MKLFRQLLVAPAALGLMAPMAATASELNVNGVSDYSAASEQVESISQFSDVYPTDWAHQALSSLVERHGCAAGTPSGTLTRYEAAALLNSCLNSVAQLGSEEHQLLNEFGPELAVLQGRIDGIEAGIGELDAGHFSTTTKLKGETVFVQGGTEETENSVDEDNNPVTDGGGESVHFVYDTRLTLNTSFSGEDLLKTRLRSGNFNNGPFSAETDTVERPAALETAYSSADSVQVDRLYYQFPIGESLTATIGAIVRQDDMLAVWPSSYPSSSILDVLTYAGAPGTYNLALGAGAGISYTKDAFNASLTYIAKEGNKASEGGLFAEDGPDDLTAQIAWVGDNWTVAAAYTTSDEESDDTDAWAFNGTWDPSRDSVSGGIGLPSVSLGFGFENNDDDATGDSTEDEFTWTLGFEWGDVGVDGNTLGIGIGSAEGWIDEDEYDDPLALELWYDIAVTDNINVTPAVFLVERDSGSGDDDITGALIRTTFKF